jgi:oligopeptide/dipeptide ABC transporter ATP-binding protein
MGNETPYVEVEHLKKYFKKGKKSFVHAVDDLTFSIEKGTTFGVVGESGCGKSTLGRTILKMLDSTAGTIRIDGEDITDYSVKEMRKTRRKMQLIFQDPYSSVDPRKTIFDIVAEPLLIYHDYKDKEDLNKKVNALLDTVGLAKMYSNSYPHELDGGRRQRAGIARALAVDPEFIICDEPVSALDVSIQAQILNLLMDLQKEKKLTYMFITHDLSVVKHISDRIMVMYLGQCVEIAESKELFSNPIHPYTKALLSAVPEPTLHGRKLSQGMIKGELTSPIDPKPGCRFASRCEHACEKCTGRDMELKQISENHFVACDVFAR